MPTVAAGQAIFIRVLMGPLFSVSPISFGRSRIPSSDLRHTPVLASSQEAWKIIDARFKTNECQILPFSPLTGTGGVLPGLEVVGVQLL